MSRPKLKLRTRPRATVRQTLTGEVARAREMRAEGAKTGEIRAALGRSKGWVLRWAPSAEKKDYDALRVEARALRRKHVPTADIAKRLDVDPKWVRMHAPASPYAANRARALAAMRARDEGWEWPAITARFGFASQNSCEVTVCRMRQRQREEIAR